MEKRCQEGQETLRRDYAATSTAHRLLSSEERRPVAWGIDTLEEIADMSGVVCRNTLELAHFLLVPADDPHLGSRDGRPNMGSCHTASGLMFIHAALPSTDSVVTAVHEAAHGSDAVPWQDYRDDCYSLQQQRLAVVLAGTYGHYIDRLISAKQFAARSDRPAKTLRRLFDRAYFAGDLTIFGLLYHALGDDGFRDLAAMDVD